MDINISSPFIIFLAVLLPFVAAYEIYMLIHLLRNKNIDKNVKVMWFIGMILIHPLVAIAYNFTDYHK